MNASEPLRYESLRNDGVGPRLGRVRTLHGPFDTPAFMPVGTQGTVKGILPDHLARTGSQVILGNTYHLMLRPGEKVVEAIGGLHRFMAWDGPILTDSGGFQVFSLSDINRISDEGVVFKSHVDGAMVELTPRRSIAVQNALGADIIMAFDQCPAAHAAREEHVAAVERTLRWAAECQSAHARPQEQSLFAIVQGGADAELRRRCAEQLVEMNFPGYAIGGLAVGEGFEAMVRVIELVAPLLPADRPRYLMGVGFPRDIVAAVAAGVDMFDCVMPTRNGRNAYAFTASGPIRLRNSKFAADSGPVEAGCDCYCCRTFTRAAIRHYFFAGEMLGPILLSVHNIRFYQRLLADVRRAIGDGTFEQFRREDPRCRMGPPEKELELA
ncbi:MAG TPA: tRNA guanosine(34) transglycosylase Tgt [Tepidisphaeraceae bacterium]|jgi:queuine tRNA-ribosyltransferase|nr:tRNA guanosine(34) transglycosylase Tgt [Tepidisphaeraceae bacterium]